MTQPRKEIEKEILRMIIQTEERERERFAQDLHDEVGPFLSGLKFYLHALETCQDEKRKILIDYIIRMIDELNDKIRAIASNQVPQNMIDIGLVGSVENLINPINKTGRVQICLEVKGKESRLEQSFFISFYRIVLEMINNSLKHAEADNIYIGFGFRKNLISFVYTDDGIGFDFENALSLSRGIGLRSIINRIKLYDGKYRFTRSQPRGISFEVSFSLKKGINY